MNFTGLFLLLVVGVVAFGVWKFCVRFKAAEGNVWQRSVSATHDSAVMLWSYLTTFTGTLLVWADYAADFFNMQEVKDFMALHISPTRLGILIIAISVVTIVARVRTLFAGKGV